jgi:hypothetical protein
MGKSSILKVPGKIFPFSLVNKFYFQMENSNKTTSIVEAQSNGTISGYFERAGSFAYIGIMVLFYITLFAIFSLS